MSDINDLDELIPLIKYIKAQNIEFSSFGKNRSDEYQKNFEKFIEFYNSKKADSSFQELLQKVMEIKEERLCNDGIFYDKDNRKVYISMKAYIQKEQLESAKLSLGSNSLELLFTKLANAIEITTPQTWNNISFYFHDIVEDHRENLIPDCGRKYGLEWLANCITIWRLMLFFGYFVFRLVKQIITFRRSSL